MQRRSNSFSKTDGFRPVYALTLVLLVTAASLAAARGIVVRSEKPIGTVSGGFSLPIRRHEGRVVVCGLHETPRGHLNIRYVLEDYSWGSAANEGKATLRYLQHFDATANLASSSVSPSELSALLEEAQYQAHSYGDQHLMIAFSLQHEGASRRDWKATFTNAWNDLMVVWILVLLTTIAAVMRLTVFTEGALGARRLRRGLCPRCQYEMSGSLVQQCPECGVSW